MVTQTKETMKITEHDALTNTTSDRDMTADELAQFEADKLIALQKAAEAVDKATAKAELLKRLGITADEAALLLA
jgi:hypothetical protein